MDYFGARYYSAAMGRFTSVDPVFNWDASVENPQYWNRYVYVRNTPMEARRHADPGPAFTGADGTNGVASLAATDKEREKSSEALWNLDVPSSKVFRYYDGLLPFMSLLHASGRFQAIVPRPGPVQR